jgi:hypothetical protein
MAKDDDRENGLAADIYAAYEAKGFTPYSVVEFVPLRGAYYFPNRFEPVFTDEIMSVNLN